VPEPCNRYRYVSTGAREVDSDRRRRQKEAVELRVAATAVGGAQLKLQELEIDAPGATVVTVHEPEEQPAIPHAMSLTMPVTQPIVPKTTAGTTLGMLRQLQAVSTRAMVLRCKQRTSLSRI